MGANPSCRSSGEELAGSTHHQRSFIFQVKRQASQESITAKTHQQAKSMSKTHTSLPASSAPIQQVWRSRSPLGKDGNGSWANLLGRSQCQTIPLPEESGAKVACAKASGCWSKPLHSRRGTSPRMQQLCARSKQGMQHLHRHGEPLRPAKVSTASITCHGVWGGGDTSSTGALAQGWQSRILPPQTAPAGSANIPACRAAPRHARGRGRKSPSASRHRRERQEAGSLLRHPLPAQSRPSSPPPRRKRG